MADELRAPFPWFGGKSRAAELVWERFGTVVNYVEPFFGSGAVLLACPEDRRPRVETVNDWNCYLANFWRAVAADGEGAARAADWPVNETDLHARHRYLLRRGPEIRALLEDPHAFDVEAAGWWVWGASAWIGSGWCAENAPKDHWKQPPLLGAKGAGGEPSAGYGSGIHAAGMREPSRKLPALKGNGGTEARGPGRPGHGDGVHSQGMREPSRQLPDLGGGTHRGPGQNRGKGIHAAGARGPSRQLPFLGGSPTQVGMGTHAAPVRTRLHDLFASLQERLRYTRVACGDWSRICTPAVTYRHGLTAVFLDPPYPGHGAVYGSTEDITPAVRAWALEHGKRKDMRVCYCGYEGDAPELEAAGWEVVAWKAKGGYGNQRETGDNENAGRERLWFSPACLRPGVDTGQLDMWGRP